MKIMNKLKKIILLLFLVIGIALTGYGISVSVNAVQVPGRAVATFSSKLYKKDAYDAFKNVKIMDYTTTDLFSIDQVKALIDKYNNLPTINKPQQDAKREFFLNGEGAKFKSYYNVLRNDDGTYDISQSPDDWVVHSRGETSDEVAAALQAEITLLEQAFADSEITQLTPGQEIVIEAYMETDDNSDILQSVAVFDINGMIDSSSSPVFYQNSEYGDMDNKQQATSYGIMLGFDGCTSGKKVPSPAYLGAVGFKVSQNPTVNKVDLVRDENKIHTVFTSGIYTTTIDMNSNEEHFKCNAPELVQQAKSSDTTLTSLTVKGNELISGSNGTANDFTGGTFGDSSVNLSATVKDNGSIESTAYIYTSKPSIPSSGTDNAPSGHTSTMNFVSGNGTMTFPSSTNAGDTVYVLFRVVANDNTTKRWCLLSIDKKQDENCNLSSLVIEGTNSGNVKQLLTESTSLNAANPTYTVYYAKNTTNFNITVGIPGYQATAVLNPGSLSLTHNNKTEFCSGTMTNNTTYTLLVTAQNTQYTNTYKIIFKEADTQPSDVKGTSGAGTNQKIVNATLNGTKYTLSNMAPGQQSYNLNMTLPAGATAEVFSDSNCTNSMGALTSGNAFNIKYDNSETSFETAKTKTVYVKITNGGISEVYEVEATRPVAENDMNFKFYNTTYDSPTATGISMTITPNVSSGVTTYKNSVKLPYDSPSAYLTIGFVNSNSKSKILSSDGQTVITDINQTITLDTGKNYTTKTFKFFVQTEYDKYNNSNGTEIQVIIEEEQPDNTNTAQTIVLKPTNGSSFTTSDYINQGNNYTYYVKQVTHGSTFTLDVTLGGSKAKAYASTSPLTADSTGKYNSSNAYNSTTVYNTGETIYLYVQAEDLSSTAYTIKIETAKNNEAGIQDIKIIAIDSRTGTESTIFETTDFNPSTYLYDKNSISKLEVPYGTKVIKWIVNLKDKNAKLNLNGNPEGADVGTLVKREGSFNLTIGDNSLKFVGVAEDGKTTSQEYIIKVSRENASTNTGITSITIAGIDCTLSSNSIYFDENKTTFNMNINNFSIYLPCSPLNTDRTVSFTLQDNRSQARFTDNEGNALTSNYVYTGNLVADKHYKFSIAVISEKELIDNSTNPTAGSTYVFHVYVGSDKHELTSLNITDSNSNVLTDSNGNTINLSNYQNYTISNPLLLDYKVTSINVMADIIQGFCGGKVYINGNEVTVSNSKINNQISLSAGVNTSIEIKVNSELYEMDSNRTSLQKIYSFYVKREECKHVNTFDNLEAIIDGNNVSFDTAFNPIQGNYVISELTSGSNISFNYTLTDTDSSVDASTPTSNIPITINFNDTTTSQTQVIEIKVNCKCGSSSQVRTYKITLSNKAITLSNTPGSITGITATTYPDNYTADKLTPSFNKNQPSYTVTLSDVNQYDNTVKFIVNIDDLKGHVKFECDNNTIIKSGSTSTVDYTLSGLNFGDTKTVTITILAEDSTTAGSVYTVTVTKPAEASKDDEPSQMFYNGIPVPNFTKNNYGPYNIHINDDTSIYFSATMPTGANWADPSSYTDNQYVDSQANSYNFPAGTYTKLFVLWIQSANSNESPQKYTFNVTRNGLKEFDDLKAEVLHTDNSTSNELSPSYSSAQKSYKVQLTKDESTVTIKWKPKDNNALVTYELSCGGNIYIASLGSDGYYSYEVKNIKSTVNAAGVDTPIVYNIKVKSNNNGNLSDETYSISISKARASDVAYISKYEYQEVTNGNNQSLNANFYTQGKVNYDKADGLSYRIDRNITYFNPTITLSDTQAIYEIQQNRTLIPGQVNKVEVVVIPASGVDYYGIGQHDYSSAIRYMFDVYPCDIDASIEDIFATKYQPSGNTFDHIIDIDDTSFIDYSNNKLKITVLNSVSTAYLYVKGNGDHYKIYLNGQVMNNPSQTLTADADNNFKIFIRSDYANAYFLENGFDPVSNNQNVKYVSDEVTVTIHRNGESHECNLSELKVTFDDANNTSYTHSLDNGVVVTSMFVIKQIPTGATTATISAIGVNPNGSITGLATVQFSKLSENNGYYVFTVTSYDEKKCHKIDYSIAIASDELNLDKNNDILEIIVTDSDGNVYLSKTKGFNPQTNTYGTFDLPFSAKSYTITVVRPSGATSSVMIDGKQGTTLLTPITDSMRGNTKNVIVNCTAKDPSVGKGPDYNISLNFIPAQTEATLEKLKADGTTVPNFDKNVFEYTLAKRPTTTNSITFSYELPKDSKATVSGDIGQQRLEYGLNKFVIIVTAEDTTTVNKYIVNVEREYPLPYLTDLVHVGEQLLDEAGKVTTFDKEVYRYTTVVPYYQLKAVIQASIDNPEYVVTVNRGNKITDATFVKEYEDTLDVGQNEFVIVVKSAHNTVQYYLTITRRPEASMDTGANSMEILQIPIFKNEYNDKNRQYNYVVPNGIRELDFKVDLYKKNDATGNGATYKIINGRESGVSNPDEKVTLRVGKNTLLVLIIAEDGITTRAVEVEVYREEMSFMVNTEAYANKNVTGSKVDDASNPHTYSIDLGNKRAKDIEDWTKFIEFDKELYDTTNEYVKTPDIEVLSDTSNKNCNEVIIRLSDGDQEVFVTLSLQSTAIGGGGLPASLDVFIPWILLLIAIILLIAILVCVNRDKYGSINKRRKKDEAAE